MPLKGQTSTARLIVSLAAWCFGVKASNCTCDEWGPWMDWSSCGEAAVQTRSLTCTQPAIPTVVAGCFIVEQRTCTPTCPPTMRLVAAADPCVGAQCPAFPGAQCIPRFCGLPAPHWWQDGREVPCGARRLAAVFASRGTGHDLRLGVFSSASGFRAGDTLIITASHPVFTATDPPTHVADGSCKLISRIVGGYNLTFDIWHMPGLTCSRDRTLGLNLDLGLYLGASEPDGALVSLNMMSQDADGVVLNDYAIQPATYSRPFGTCVDSADCSTGRGCTPDSCASATCLGGVCTCPPEHWQYPNCSMECPPWSDWTPCFGNCGTRSRSRFLSPPIDLGFGPLWSCSPSMVSEACPCSYMYTPYGGSTSNAPILVAVILSPLVGVGVIIGCVLACWIWARRRGRFQKIGAQPASRRPVDPGEPCAARFCWNCGGRFEQPDFHFCPQCGRPAAVPGYSVVIVEAFSAPPAFVKVEPLHCSPPTSPRKDGAHP